MANHKSAAKRHRQNLKRNAANRDARATLRTVVKKALTLADSGKKEEASAAAREATKLYAKAASKGLVHKRNAKRHISRLNTAVAKGAK